MTARLPPLDADAAASAAASCGVPAALGDLNVFRVLLAHPRLARNLSDLLLTLLSGDHLDARLRELAILRVGWVTASVYEWTQHWHLAPGFGVDADDAAAVRDGPDHPRFGPAERAVLAATDQTLATGAVSAATWQACRRHVSQDQRALLELVGTIGVWRTLSELLRSLEIPLEEDVAPWPPDGRRPDGASVAQLH